MTAKKPTDMPQRGQGITALQAVHEEQDLFWEEYGQAVDDVETLYKHFEREITSNPHAAATLTLATIMNLEEVITDDD